MFALVMLALLTTLFGMAFPPLLILAAVLWYVVGRKMRQRVAAVRAIHTTKYLRAQQRRTDQALRFFS